MYLILQFKVFVIKVFVACFCSIETFHLTQKKKILGRSSSNLVILSMSELSCIQTRSILKVFALSWPSPALEKSISSAVLGVTQSVQCFLASVKAQGHSEIVFHDVKVSSLMALPALILPQPLKLLLIYFKIMNSICCSPLHFKCDSISWVLIFYIAQSWWRTCFFSDAFVRDENWQELGCMATVEGSCSRGGAEMFPLVLFVLESEVLGIHPLTAVC